MAFSEAPVLSCRMRSSSKRPCHHSADMWFASYMASCDLSHVTEALHLRKGGSLVTLQVTDLESYVSQLESELSAEQRRRQTEQLRALIEGARFLLHKSTGASERHVWYRCGCATLLSRKLLHARHLGGQRNWTGKPGLRMH